MKKIALRWHMTWTYLAACGGLLHGCGEPPSVQGREFSSLLDQLKDQTHESMVFIEGGSFVMGDFGAVGEDGVWRPYFPPVIEEDKPHEVTLSSYSLSKHKTTWRDFDTYLIDNDLPAIVHGLSENWERELFEQNPESRLYVEKPAQVTWQQAKDYCQWLAQQTGLPLDLPTSAQWEYAARNRGSQDWLYSSHDGQWLEKHRDLAEKVYEGADFVPVGSRLPPNPLGLYDMLDNGKEWVNDWFSKTYYQESDGIVDPQGPAQGTEKVVRNLDTGSLGFSFSRIGMPESLPSMINDDWVNISEYTFRCAAQSHEATPQ